MSPSSRAAVARRGVAAGRAQTAAGAAGRGPATAAAVVRVDVHERGHAAVVAGVDATAIDGTCGTGVSVAAGSAGVVETLLAAGSESQLKVELERA